MRVSLFVLALLPLMSSASLLGAIEEMIPSFGKGEGGGGTLPGGGKIWAVLVAGSRNFFNYRHQADVCHAYQILSSHGIPDEQIIVMMFDDIAYSSMNKEKGIIRNRPGGPNVYTGVPKDFTGHEVTPQNFLNVLTGNKTGLPEGKKFVDSGPDDHIFVYMADHGSPGFFCFPNTNHWSGWLSASMLGNATVAMKKNKRYNKMVYYVEACESGSMFDHHLASDLDVYATSASNDSYSSFACYFDKTIGTYLGDVYSIMWLQDSDAENLEKETLEDQFRLVRSETTTSPVQQFGDTSGVASMPVAQFQGLRDLKKRAPFDYRTEKERDDDKDACRKSAVDSRKVARTILARNLVAATTPEETKKAKLALRQYNKEARAVNQVFYRVAVEVANKNENEGDERKTSYFRIISNKRGAIENEACYEAAVHHFTRKCPRMSGHDRAPAMVYVLNNLCNEGFPLADIKTALDHQCARKDGKFGAGREEESNHPEISIV